MWEVAWHRLPCQDILHQHGLRISIIVMYALMQRSRQFVLSCNANQHLKFGDQHDSIIHLPSLLSRLMIFFRLLESDLLVMKKDLKQFNVLYCLSQDFRYRDLKQFNVLYCLPQNFWYHPKPPGLGHTISYRPRTDMVQP